MCATHSSLLNARDCQGLRHEFFFGGGVQKKKIISFGVSIGPHAQFVEQIAELGRARHSSYVCVANVHMVIEAWRDQSFARIINDADIVTPDGMPLVKAMQLLYGIRQDRVAGMDLVPSLLTAAEKKRLAVFLYGTTDEVLTQVVDKIRKECPKLTIAGSLSPPFRPLSSEEDAQITDQINKSGANIVLVALGCPKQENWMAAHKGRVNAVMVGVGGSFPVYAGLQKRAPAWMCRWSLEWFYRFQQEPQRLFRRYLVTNTLFLLLMGREMVRRRKG